MYLLFVLSLKCSVDIFATPADGYSFSTVLGFDL